jgi:small subunit ribosomal protein S17e
MGKIKSKLIKRSANELIKEGIEFTEDFGENKKILGSNTMPSKKIRNQMAGYITRLKKQKRKEKEELQA